MSSPARFVSAPRALLTADLLAVVLAAAVFMAALPASPRTSQAQESDPISPQSYKDIEEYISSLSEDDIGTPVPLSAEDLGLSPEGEAAFSDLAPSSLFSLQSTDPQTPFYDFAVNFVSINGNIPTVPNCDRNPLGTPRSFFDSFNDGFLDEGCTSHFQRYGTFEEVVDESGNGLLHMRSAGGLPGSGGEGIIVRTSQITYDTTFRSDRGNFFVAPIFRPDAVQGPPLSSFYGFFLIDKAGGPPALNFQVAREPNGRILAAAGSSLGSTGFRSNVIDLSGKTSILLGASFDRETGLLTAFYSFDLGQTFFGFRNPDGTPFRVPLFVNSPEATFIVAGAVRERVPVVLVPGIMGSRLNREADDVEAWPSVNQMTSLTDLSDSYLNDLKLDANGGEIQGRQMGPASIIDREGVFGVAEQDFYGSLLDMLSSKGYVLGETLFPASYDWRFDIREEVQRLADIVDQARAGSPSGAVDIVAHSMGGLLVKEYLAQQADTPFVNKLVLAGVPQLGAPRLFNALNFGDDLDFHLGFFSILNPDRVKEITQNFPSAYQLLPSRRYIDVNGGYVKDFRSGIARILTYDETSDFMREEGRNSSLLDRADAFHQTRDGAPFNASLVYNMVGCGIPTFGQFRIYDGGKYDITAINGDNRVPVTSGANLGGSFFRNYFAAAYNHTGLIRDAEPVALIKNILEDKQDDLPQGISLSSAGCFAPPITSEQILFSSHSPVELHIFDSQNRHVGPLENGNVELAVPGSQYFSIAENSFVYVPAGDTYRVELQATAAGAADFRVETLRALETETKLTYLNVPLASSQTKAELVFTTVQGDLALRVDSEGDGVVDAFLQPNALLAAEEAADITPPTITAPSVPSEVTLNTPFTFAFSATDDLSGVAILKATFNGDPIESGEEIVLSRVGRSVFEITAIDRAGNPSVRQVEFSVVYDFSGFLPPLHMPPVVLQVGRGIAIKFEIKDAAGAPVSGAQALLFLAPLTNGEPGEFQPAAPEGNSNTANEFRFDERDEQYVYNWSTRGLEAGLYRLKAELDDGKSHFVDVELRSGGQQRTFFNLFWANLSGVMRSFVEMLKKL